MLKRPFEVRRRVLLLCLVSLIGSFTMYEQHLLSSAWRETPLRRSTFSSERNGTNLGLENIHNNNRTSLERGTDKDSFRLQRSNNQANYNDMLRRSKTITVKNITTNENPVETEGATILFSETSSTSKASPAIMSKTNVSIVVQLSGELGNHLSKIAFGKVLEWRLRDDYGIQAYLVLQHQAKGGKWVSAMDDCQRCFKALRTMDFSLGNTEEFQVRLEQQEQLLGPQQASKLVLPILASHQQIQDGLYSIASLVQTTTHLPSSNTTTSMLKNPNVSKPAKGFFNDDNHQYNISLPFLYAQSFGDLSHIDRYYDELRTFFKLDEKACCQDIPSFDETVFHFRNFIHEMPRRGVKRGFEELNARQTAHELLGHLNSGDKVAITSRFITSPEVLEYQQILQQEKGLQVRLVTNHSSSGVQDFCFVTKAKHEVVGLARSTFLLWAVLLGNATTSWMYSVASNATRQAAKRSSLMTQAIADVGIMEYRFENSELQRRIRFVSFETSTV